MSFKWEKSPRFRLYDSNRGLEVVDGPGDRHISSFKFSKIGFEDEILGLFRYCDSGRKPTKEEKLICPPEVSWIYILDFRGFSALAGGGEYLIKGFSEEESMVIAEEMLLEYGRFRAGDNLKIIRYKIAFGGENEKWLGEMSDSNTTNST